MTRFRTCLLVFAIAAAQFAAEASAQPYLDATAKSSGYYKYGPSHGSASRRLRHARDYAVDVHAYTHTAKKVDPKAAQKDVAEIDRNLKGAKEDFDHIRKQAGANKAAKPHLDAIDKHLATAQAEVKKLHDACEAGELTKDSTHTCCSAIYESLEKATEEHEALLKKMEK